MQREWIKLVEQNLGMQAASSFESIVSNQTKQWSKVEQTTKDISIIHRQKSNSSSRNNSSNSLLPPKKKSNDVYSSISFADSGMHILTCLCINLLITLNLYRVGYKIAFFHQ